MKRRSTAIATAAIAAGLVMPGTVHAAAPSNASCEGTYTSEEASSGLYKNARIGGIVLELGGTAWAGFQKEFAQSQPCG